MSEVICKTIKLCKKYKDTNALSNVNFQIKRGEIYGLIGENGAGKTTLLKLLTGLSFSTSGEIELFGEKEEQYICKKRKKMGCIIENPALYPDMTAKQNLEIKRIQMGIPGKGCIEDVLSLVNLEKTGKKKVKDFSLGMKQRLSLALALLGEPELLILDEPVNGLDPTGIIELRQLLLTLNKERGITIIISSHILSELYKLATHYGIIHKGKLIEQMTASKLDEKCQKHIYIKVDDVKSAALVLDHTLGIKEYDICENNAIKIYGHFDDCSLINKELSRKGIYAHEITVKGDSLESYFSKVIGGGQYV